MDVKNPLFIAFTFLLPLLLISCSENKQPAQSTVLRTNSDSSCAATRLENTYIVTWKDGSISKVKKNSLAELESQLITPFGSEIQMVENDYKVYLDQPLQNFSNQHDPIDWGVQYIGAEKLWAQNIEGENVIVAVIDSGLDLSHPQLKGKVFENTLDIPGNGIDDDQNGYIDDYIGWNFYHDSSEMEGDMEHGTHVSGIIGADNLEGEAKGVTLKSKILPLKFIDGDNGGSISDAVLALDYAYALSERENKPMVINNSWGGSFCSDTLKAKMAQSSKHRVLLVSAAGNSGLDISDYPVYPAAFRLPNQVTVGAYSFRFLMAGFSNRGKLVDLVAPGIDIFNTVPGGTDYLHGTSMAAPFVSGGAALLWSALPNARPEKIKQAILESVDKKDNYYVSTSGSLNLELALKRLQELMP